LQFLRTIFSATVSVAVSPIAAVLQQFVLQDSLEGFFATGNKLEEDCGGKRSVYKKGRLIETPRFKLVRLLF
jgi:hypothetical protein